MTAKETISECPNIENHTQLVDAPPGGQSTVGHQGAIHAPPPNGTSRATSHLATMSTTFYAASSAVTQPPTAATTL